MGTVRATAVTLLVLSMFGTSVPVAGQPPPEPRLAHFPREAYRGEPATFVVRARPGLQARALLEGEPIAHAISSDDGVLELTVALKRAGRLRVEAGGTGFEFVVVTPGSAVSLRTTDGFVYQEGVPVVLLVEHRHPPRTDRRWQTLKVAQSLLHDNRPRVSSAVLAAPSSLTPAELSGLPSPGGNRVGSWQQPPDVEGLYEIDRLIARVCAAPAADLLLVALGADDLARGMSLDRVRVRLEWLLQHAATRYDHMFVVLTPHTAAWYAEKCGAVALAAAANGATYLPTRAKVAADAGLAEAIEHLRRRVAF